METTVSKQMHLQEKNVHTHLISEIAHKELFLALDLLYLLEGLSFSFPWSS